VECFGKKEDQKQAMGRVVNSVEELDALLNLDNKLIRSYIIFACGDEGVYLIHDANVVNKRTIPMNASPILYQYLNKHDVNKFADIEEVAFNRELIANR
jgi:hypothetical protein